MKTRTVNPARPKVIPIQPTSPEPRAEEWTPLTRVLLAVILAILFVAFLNTTPPTGDPEPCRPPQQGLWPQCR